MTTISQRLVAIVVAYKKLRDLALEAEKAGHKFSQSELRVMFQTLKRLSVESGRVQFDMRNSPVWEHLTEKDRASLDGFVNGAIAGLDAIKEALGESPEVL
jgi:hypothetical protein